MFPRLYIPEKQLPFVPGRYYKVKIGRHKGRTVKVIYTLTGYAFVQFHHWQFNLKLKAMQ